MVNDFKQKWITYTNLQKELVKTRKELNQNYFEDFLTFSLKGVINDLKDKCFQKDNGQIFKILDIKHEILLKEGYNIYLHTDKAGVITIYFKSLSVPENLYKSLVGNYISISEIEFRKKEKQKILKEIECLQKKLKEL